MFVLRTLLATWWKNSRLNFNGFVKLEIPANCRKKTDKKGLEVHT